MPDPATLSTEDKETLAEAGECTASDIGTEIASGVTSAGIAILRMIAARIRALSG